MSRCSTSSATIWRTSIRPVTSRGERTLPIWSTRRFDQERGVPETWEVSIRLRWVAAARCRRSTSSFSRAAWRTPGRCLTSPCRATDSSSSTTGPKTSIPGPARSALMKRACWWIPRPVTACSDSARSANRMALIPRFRSRATRRSTSRSARRFPEKRPRARVCWAICRRSPTDPSNRWSRRSTPGPPEERRPDREHC